jgi:hypothetical protein
MRDVAHDLSLAGQSRMTIRKRAPCLQTSYSLPFLRQNIRNCRPITITPTSHNFVN